MLPACDAIINDIQQLATIVCQEQEKGKSVVFTNGCYDILHAGHVYLLEKAKALGDILIVGLNTDDSVRRQNKDKYRPIIPLQERAFVLAHLASVDYVIPFDEDTPYLLIENIQPDVLVKGGDWDIDSIVGADIVYKKGGSVHSIPLMNDYSTTAIVNKLRQIP